MLYRILSFVCLVCVSSNITAQQVPEADYHPPVLQPAYPAGFGPRVFIDEAHHNFHTAQGRYKAFAQLLRRDGYAVEGFKSPFTPEALQHADVLVIVNALNERNESDWSLPTPSAFTADEIDAVRCRVCNGGALLLIADHMPFPGAANELANAFGVEFSNGYARPGDHQSGVTDKFDRTSGLWPGIVVNGRFPQEQVSRIATFSGSAFIPPLGATPVLLFGTESISYETTEAPGITDDAIGISIEGWCQGAVFTYGRGRVAVFGEAAMFTAQLAGEEQRPMGMNHPDASQNHQLALNVMRWLSGANNTSPVYGW